MSHLSFQNRLQMFGHRLSKSEQKIAAYIVAHPKEAASAGSQELVKAVGTSNSTLTRFCQKLNYRNYIEFQTLLSSEKTPSRAPDYTLQKISHYYGSVLSSASELANTADLDAFISRVRQANKILIFGLGSSGLTASELNMRLVQMGFTSSAMTDTFLMRVQSSLFSPQDLVIAVSNSGETPEVVGACRIAKSVGAQIGVLTQNSQTELAGMADAILYAGNIRQTGDPLFINSQMPLMFLIDAISYRLLEDDACRENRDRALQILFHRDL
ncbi:MAG: MurR/RpiR family transcriptional regulator [Eubacteriales bacterium]|nr:MurR/RpiR family transcriptional regulator [Eubacteriales bacterium]